MVTDDTATGAERTGVTAGGGHLLTVQLVGGPTAVLEYAGIRWLTDPTLSPPGEYDGRVKTTGPALDGAAIGSIDVVLLSHDHHSDNLDPAGREFLPSVRRVVSTVAGAERLGGNVIGLEPWSSFELERPDGGTVTVTATPAQHGPDGTDHVTGPVIGFLLGGRDLETVYVSGDNASLDVVRTIAERAGAIDMAVLFAGAARRSSLFNGAYLTLSSDGAAEAAKILGARAVVPVHFEGWSHFTQGADALHAAFAGNGITDRLVLAARGETVRVQRPPVARLPKLASAAVKLEEDRSCGGTRAAHARAEAGHR
jgi:L-ascorbate metabolism protein UlaG (beta-lactamase superfamily)